MSASAEYIGAVEFQHPLDEFADALSAMLDRSDRMTHRRGVSTYINTYPIHCYTRVTLNHVGEGHAERCVVLANITVDRRRAGWFKALLRTIRTVTPLPIIVECVQDQWFYEKLLSYGFHPQPSYPGCVYRR